MKQNINRKRSIKQLFTVRDVGDYDELIQLAIGFKNDTNYFFSRYSGIKSLGRLSFRKLRDQDISHNPLVLKQLHLRGHYLQRCLNRTVGNIKANWSNLLQRVKRTVRDHPNLTNSEKQFLYIVSNSTVMVDKLLNTNCPFRKLLAKKNFDSWKARQNSIDATRENYIRSYYRRIVRRLKGRIPHSNKENHFIADSTLYRFGKSNLSIMRPKNSRKYERILLVPSTSQTFTTEANCEL